MKELNTFTQDATLSGVPFRDFVAFRERADIGAVPGLFVFQHLCERRMLRRYGSRLSHAVTIVHKGQYKAAYATAREVKTLQENILKRILRDRSFITDCKLDSEIAAHELLRFCTKMLSPTGLKSMKNDGLKSIYAGFVRRYSAFNFCNIPLWMVLGDTLASYLWEQFERLGGGVSDFQVMHTSTSDTFIKREERDFLAIGVRMQRQRRRSRLSIPVEELLQSHLATKAIEEHCAKYSWIEFDYLGPLPLTVLDFSARMRTLLSDQHLVERLAALRHEASRLSGRQRAIKSKYKVSGPLWRLFKDLQILGDLTDYRKEICTQAHVYLQLYLYPEISRRVGLPRWGPRYMSLGEVSDCLVGKEWDRGSVLSRRKCVGLVSNGIDTVVLSETSTNEAWLGFQPQVQSSDRVTGQSASVGIATGRVNVIRSATQLAKMQSGDVLVAPMTTPDFAQALHKARAIVTDEGGVTCHAAIVSRELGIPCVIGTRVATSIFKDGEVIEVDGDRGVVRRITDEASRVPETRAIPITPIHIRRPRQASEVACGPLVVNLDDPRAKDESLTGGKAATLARLRGQWRVPAGLCLTVPAFEQYLIHNRLAPQIESYLGKLDVNESGTAERISRGIARLFMGGDLPPQLRRELADGRMHLKRSLAVRSSAIGEDGHALSFAGQHSTYLNVSTSGRLQEAVKRCWSSLYSSRALSYRVAHSLDPLDAKIAVLIQELVDAKTSGTVFTVNPVNGFQELVIEATFGLGEALVSGAITPDKYRVDRMSLRPIEIVIGSKLESIVPHGKEGTQSIILSRARQARPCLSVKESREIAGTALDIEAAMGCPQDIEWAISQSGTIYILQSRPITVYNGRHRKNS